MDSLILKAGRSHEVIPGGFADAMSLVGVDHYGWIRQPQLVVAFDHRQRTVQKATRAKMSLRPQSKRGHGPSDTKRNNPNEDALLLSRPLKTTRCQEMSVSGVVSQVTPSGAPTLKTSISTLDGRPSQASKLPSPDIFALKRQKKG